ncbi:MAG: amidase [Candidatus Promineifilaceae bacterium]|nr:amidase [Candidatus Promineifilaceae bacterium]
MSSHPPNSLLSLAAKLRSSDLPLHAYLDQLQELFERREPEVLAFVPEDDRFGRLHREADALLTAYPQVENRPFLFGVPVGVKDIFHVSGLLTKAGSKLPVDQLQDVEALSVTTLRSAGALILGKTVTTEFAYFAPGPTHNPHVLDHTPGGSSSGSAAAVAAGLCPLTLGTQTIGSINRPAAFCGVVGYKPSYDRISRQGVIPLSPSADHVGLFVPAAADVAPVAALLCKDWRAATGTVTNRPILGIPEGPYLENVSAVGLEHFQAACGELLDAGFEVKRVATMLDFDEIVARHNFIVAADAANVHKDWYREYRELYHEKTADLIERGMKVSQAQLERAQQGQLKLRQELSAQMRENHLDLWISPAAIGPAPAGLNSTGDPIMNLPWTHAGLPTLSLPAGQTANGLPLGLQLAADWYADEQLNSWSESIAKVVSS